MKSNRVLWTAINAHILDKADAVTPFSKKLCQEQKWSAEFARQAIEEYKRFIYLVAIGHQTLSPSPSIDKVWHLHLTYTKDYWGQFCKQTIGRDIHHMPSDGSRENEVLFKKAYGLTLSLYYEEFGVLPPAKFWPTPQKPVSFPHLPDWRVFLCLGTGLGLVSCAPYMKPNRVDIFGIVLFGSLTVLNLFFALKGIKSIKQFFSKLLQWSFFLVPGLVIGWAILDTKGTKPAYYWLAFFAFLFTIFIHYKKNTKRNGSRRGNGDGGGSDSGNSDSGSSDSGCSDSGGSSCGGCGGGD